MSCACGHHHPKPEHHCESTGISVKMEQPLIALSGHLICADTAEMMLALSLLPEHIQLSRAEPGCLRFDIWQDDDPMIWNLAEVFVNADAFAAHQSRTQSSQWGRESSAIKRDFEKREVTPIIRPVKPSDADGIAKLFGEQSGTDNTETKTALVAEAASALLGYVALQDDGMIGPVVSSKLTGPEVADALRQDIMRIPV